MKDRQTGAEDGRGRVQREAGKGHGGPGVLGRQEERRGCEEGKNGRGFDRRRKEFDERKNRGFVEE